jgi:hypothetical protein
MVWPVTALIVLALLRILAAAAETLVAAGGAARREALIGDDLLASLACAAGQVAVASGVGVITVLVWRHPGRGLCPSRSPSPCRRCSSCSTSCRAARSRAA